MVDEKNQVSEENLSEDDLDKIMKEIVAEEAVTTTTDDAAKTAPVGSDATSSTVTTASAETTPSKNTSAATAGSGPIASVSPIRVVNSTSSKTTGAANSGQSLRLEFTGPINLKLEFTTGGKSIELNCSNDALVCRMADGTEFKIPTSSIAASKKAA